MNLYNPLEDKIETTSSTLSKVSGNPMIIVEVNGVPCWCNVQDRLAVPVDNDKNVI